MDTETDVIQQILDSADEHMDADNYDKALETLQYALRRPEFDIRVYQKAAFVLRMLGRQEAAELFEGVVADPEDPNPCFQLGYQLVQEGLFGSALGPLSRCVRLAPDAAAANYEFAYALMKEFYNEEALHFFARAYEQEQAMSITFYMAQLLLFLGHKEEAASFASKLEEQVRESGEGQAQLDYLRGMFQRASSFPPHNLRDWHFVQYGGLLLRLFEEDHPGEPNESNGRYTFVNFGYDQTAAVLGALQAVVQQTPVFQKYEFAAPAGETSAPLAHALSGMFEIPVLSLEEGLAANKRGIVITAFSDELDPIAADVWDRKDILLFSFAFSWTRESNILPEAIGYLAQGARLPWQARYEAGENGEPVLVEADNRSAGAIAQSILDRLSHIDREWLTELRRYYAGRQFQLVAGNRIEVPRKKFFVHSALGGGRFT
ncbi:tetratricopeptide repeat protein [Effusibacillus lacus]|uniref:Uncharacterized protein n=1 Tax=Effusibacillus lacus TaxID=1348429 RepID=A0A292YL70_9BACL|nr:hypothetical protein [Effusibacillus lacus]TCS68770.1 hypothetical protein EDD64_14020 [Effusibacillus lacus]GAX90688.1 hypothetical protein EFBL_2326 [Effusibacillus lacus]